MTDLKPTGRRQQAAETKAASDALDAQRQAMSETADAFRGVHLDPNAHHWDDVCAFSNFASSDLLFCTRWKRMTMTISWEALSSSVMAGNTRFKFQMGGKASLNLTKIVVEKLSLVSRTDLLTILIEVGQNRDLNRIANLAD